jgi:thioredoxin 2
MTGGPYTVRCAECGQKNRVPADKIDRPGKCGRCGAALKLTDLLTGKPLTVTDRSFSDQVLASPLPVILDCWAPWCGPCRTVGPVVDQLAQEYRGRVRVGKLNTDENPQTAARFQVRSIPTLLVFDRGQLVETIVGAQPKEAIARALAPHLY